MGAPDPVCAKHARTAGMQQHHARSPHSVHRGCTDSASHALCVLHTAVHSPPISPDCTPAMSDPHSLPRMRTLAAWLHAVKVLTFLTMPIDPKSAHPQRQVECVQKIKVRV
jgi:hypothetical protein